jgi:hypothetical protein
MAEQWSKLHSNNPEISGELELPSQIIQQKRHFENLENVYTETFYTDKQYIWQMVDYDQDRKDTNQELYRGYLMIETADIPQASRLLHAVYTEEFKDRGHKGRFKWLMRKLPEIETTKERINQAEDMTQLGSYANLEDIDPRIVLYEHTPQDIQRILSSLSSLKEWEAIEQNRRLAFSENPPIRGSHHFIDSDNNDRYSLSYYDNIVYF